MHVDDDLILSVMRMLQTTLVQDQFRCRKETKALDARARETGAMFTALELFSKNEDWEFSTVDEQETNRQLSARWVLK